MLGQKLGFVFVRIKDATIFFGNFLTFIFFLNFELLFNSIEEILSTIYLFSNGIQAENGLTKQGMDYSITWTWN